MTAPDAAAPAQAGLSDQPCPKRMMEPAEAIPGGGEMGGRPVGTAGLFRRVVRRVGDDGHGYTGRLAPPPTRPGHGGARTRYRSRAIAFFSRACAEALIWQTRAAPMPNTWPISSRLSSST